MRQSGQHSGFTLFELIIALTLTAMLAASLSVSLRTAFKASDLAEAKIAPARTAQIALDLIGHDLENALPPPSSLTSDITLAGPFEGTDNGSSDTIEFYTIGHGVDEQNPTLNDGIWKIDIDVEALPDGTTALVRHVTKNLMAPTQTTPPAEVLCRNVTTLDVQYLSDDTLNPSWDSTAESDALPQAVQINLVVHRDTPSGGEDYTMTRTYQLPCAVDPNATDTTGGTQ